MSQKRTVEPDEEDNKRRVADDHDNDDSKYFLDRWTCVPIINPVLKREYNDLRSRLSQYPSDLICYEIDPRVGEKLPPGEVSDNEYRLVPPTTDLKPRWRIDKDHYAMYCNGIRGEIIVALPISRQIFILDKNGVEQQTFSITITALNGIGCMDVYSNGDIAISGHQSQPIYCFSRSGALLRSIDTEITNGLEFIPLLFAIDERDNLYAQKQVADFYPIHVYSVTGQFVRMIDTGYSYIWSSMSVHKNHLYMAGNMVGNHNAVFVDLKADTVGVVKKFNLREEHFPIKQIFFDSNDNILVSYTTDNGTQFDLFSLKDFVPVLLAKKLTLSYFPPLACLDSNGDIWATTAYSSETTIQRYSAREQPTGQSI
jgi:hypothetical protein